VIQPHREGNFGARQAEPAADHRMGDQHAFVRNLLIALFDLQAVARVVLPAIN
jgi:hypothetical protein